EALYFLATSPIFIRFSGVIYPPGICGVIEYFSFPSIFFCIFAYFAISFLLLYIYINHILPKIKYFLYILHYIYFRKKFHLIFYLYIKNTPLLKDVYILIIKMSL